MAYLSDRLKWFGVGNWLVRWVEFISAILVLVLGGVVPLEKIGDTSDLGLVTYDGIYVTAAATRFTIFAGAFGTASIGYILIASMLKFMERDWHTWFILVLDILNWIFFLVSWASLAAAISTTTNALLFCKNSQIQNIIDSTPNLAGDIISYLRGLQQACDMTYAGLTFGIVAWLCFWGSVFYTAKMLMNSSDDADLTAEERSEAGHTFQGTEGEAEAKSEAAIESPTSEVPPSVETEAKPGVTAGVTA